MAILDAYTCKYCASDTARVKAVKRKLVGIIAFQKESINMTIKNDFLSMATTTSLVAAILFVEAAFCADPIFVDAEAVEFDPATDDVKK